MLANYRRFERPNRSRVVAIRVCLIVALFFLSSVGISSASAQEIAHYSDSWVFADGNEDSTDPIIIVGAGVTEDNYTTDGHTYGITVKLTSPDGRVSQTTGEFTMWYSRNEGELQWNSDEGDYVTRSTHWSHCPMDPDGFNFVSGLSTFRFPVGKFRQTYAYRAFIPEQQTHWYSIDCIGPCTSPVAHNKFFSTFRGSYYVCDGVRVTFFGTSCIGRCRGSGIHEGCF